MQDDRLTAFLAIQKKVRDIVTDIDEVCGGNFSDLPTPIAELAYSFESNEEAAANGTLVATPNGPTPPPTLEAFAASLQPVIDALQKLPQTA